MTNALLWILLVLVSLMFLVMAIILAVFCWWVLHGGE